MGNAGSHSIRIYTRVEGEEEEEEDLGRFDEG